MDAQRGSEGFPFLKSEWAAARQAYPELFANLSNRDQVVRRTLRWIPPRGDPEAYIGVERLERLLDDLRHLPPGIPGIADLCPDVGGARGARQVRCRRYVRASEQQG